MVTVFKVTHTWVPTEYVKVEGSLHHILYFTWAIFHAWNCVIWLGQH